MPHVKTRTTGKELSVSRAHKYPEASFSGIAPPSLRIVSRDWETLAPGCTEEPTGDPPSSPDSGRTRTLDPKVLPYWLTVEEAADWLRTTPKAIYARNARGQLAGAFRDGRRLLIQRDAFLRSLVVVSSPEGLRP
jgi:hypothetical protein